MPNSGEKKIDFSGASLGGVNIDSTAHGDQIGTQHQYAPEQKQSLAEAAAEIQQLLEQLAQTNPTIVQAANLVKLLCCDADCNLRGDCYW